MKFCLITFRSVTPAQRSEGVLQRSGIPCTLRRTPRWMEEQGCGYSVRVSLQDAVRAGQILRREQMPFRKIYLIKDNGSAEELAI